jgi:hypothetical protein
MSTCSQLQKIKQQFYHTAFGEYSMDTELTGQGAPHSALKTTNEEASQEHFSPKGAFVFFVGLMAFFALLWFSMYAEMLSRR